MTPTPEICPFALFCGTIPKGVDCEHGNYVKCWKYSDWYFTFSLALPQVCPLYDSCKTKCHENPPYMERYDYRECIKFSKWFWKKLIQQLGAQHDPNPTR